MTAPAVPAEIVPTGASSSRAPHDESAPSLRQLVEFVLVLFLATILFRGFIVEGYFVPTGSMAPGLVGFHTHLVCPKCGYAWNVGREPGDILPPQLTCPDCRDPAVPTADKLMEAGDRLLVLKGAFDVKPPKRWETVVFYNPNDPRQAYVKRAIGLPGEQVEIRQGNVYINGQIARKSLAELQALALPVNQFHPANQPRWHSDTSSTEWTPNIKGVDIRAQDHPPTNFFTYHHLDVRGQETPVTDENSYNAAQFGTAQEFVRDLLIRGRVAHATGNGYVALEYRLHPGLAYELRLHPTRGRVELWENGRLRKEAIMTSWKNGSREFLFAYWDARLGIRLNGIPPWDDLDLSPDDITAEPISTPLRFAARDYSGNLTDLALDRDVHYRTSRFAQGRLEAPHQLHPGEYFVLGDNSAISNDSRSWSIPAVPKHLLIGKPLFVHLPTRAWRGIILGRTVRFAYPDFARMRIVR